MSRGDFRRFLRAVSRIPVAPVRKKIITNAKSLIRSHESRHASLEDRKVFVDGAKASIELLEALSEKQLEDIFCHPRWKQT